jgi:plasmid maintenance system antidote protein VapI
MLKKFIYSKTAVKSHGIIRPANNRFIKKMDWSQKILAHHLRVTPQYINALVRNKKGLSDKKAAHITAVANHSPEEFKMLHLNTAYKYRLMDSASPETIGNSIKFIHNF